jgi:DNA repair exonuclease SbcCD ATPase subunit
LAKEKAEVHEDLRQKMAEIGEMHKEVEEKSEKLAEKDSKIDALLMQLNESTRFLNYMGRILQLQF